MATLQALSRAIRAVAPGLTAPELADWTAALGPELDRGQVTTPRRIAAVLGQVGEESGGFEHLEENLSYSAARECVVWPTRFPTLAAAQACAGNPERLADTVYANRMGNGDAASGDGWTFRGRGLIDLTGRELYRQFGASVGMTPEDAALYLQTHVGAARGAVWFWSQHSLNELADAWDITTITRRVNGGLTNLANRQRLSAAALKELS